MTIPAGRSVMVTGACGGIGGAIARRFAADGARLALCDIEETMLARLVGELREAGVEIHDGVVDVADELAVQPFCAASGEALGGIDALINTVGVVEGTGDVEELETSEWNRVIAINLTSSFLTAKHCVPLLKRNGGVIVNVSSVSALANQEDHMVYSVTKAGLLALTRSQAIDLARHNIRAVAICPGSVYTPLIEEAAGAIAERAGRDASDQLRDWESQYPTRRFSMPEEVADLAHFLCSDQASNITGTAVIIDGGLTALLPERV